MGDVNTFIQDALKIIDQAKSDDRNATNSGISTILSSVENTGPERTAAIKAVAAGLKDLTMTPTGKERAAELLVNTAIFADREFNMHENTKNGNVSLPQSVRTMEVQLESTTNDKPNTKTLLKADREAILDKLVKPRYEILNKEAGATAEIDKPEFIAAALKDVGEVLVRWDAERDAKPKEINETIKMLSEKSDKTPDDAKKLQELEKFMKDFDRTKGDLGKILKEKQDAVGTELETSRKTASLRDALENSKISVASAGNAQTLPANVKGALAKNDKGFGMNA